MTLTVAYVRVSTEDQVDYSPEAQVDYSPEAQVDYSPEAQVDYSPEAQVDYSPEAQASRCRQHDLGAVTVIPDEGWSGSTLERPGMAQLRSLVEEGKVAHVVVWRLDRLSRDTGDLSVLVKQFEAFGVALHSVNEGRIDLDTAAGKLQVGFHGLLAQYYRHSLIENVRMGQDQAVRKGRWLNRLPTGYDMIDGELVPNETAPIVQRIFKLRARGLSYTAIEAEVGLCYSTVRQIANNRVYTGMTRLGSAWHPGIHQPLVTQEEFDSAHRGHIKGRRRGRDLLSGRVKCGMCGRVVCVDYNERGHAIYRCKYRGRGCDQPGRSANGLHRAAQLGLRLLSNDPQLQTAIRKELNRHQRPVTEKGANRESALRTLEGKRPKLLDLHYADKISQDTFADEDRRLSTQIATLRNEQAQVEAERRERDELAQRFEAVAAVLAVIDIDEVWDAATAAEKAVLVEDLVDAVTIFPDHIEVHITGAPKLNVELAEVGLREPGTRTSVSEGGPNPHILSDVGT